MESAFGVEHGEIGKALSLPHRVALNKFPGLPSSADTKGLYAKHRLAARYQSAKRGIPGSDFKEMGAAHKDLARQEVNLHSAVGRKLRRLP
jgi:hypothetical protein